MQGDLQSGEIGDRKNKNVVTISHINFGTVEIEQKLGCEEIKKTVLMMKLVWRANPE